MESPPPQLACFFRITREPLAICGLIRLKGWRVLAMDHLFRFKSQQPKLPMSRLDSFIRRMQAQRLLIDYASDAIKDIAGPVLELGLGKGRTYHHLRERLPERRVIVLDLKVTELHESSPPPQDLLLGDIKETARGLVGIGAALLHSDIGPGNPERGEETAHWLPGLVPMLLAQGGLALSDEPLENPQLVPLPLPGGIPERRYFLYRRE
jgi:hypothetical protein